MCIYNSSDPFDNACAEVRAWTTTFFVVDVVLSGAPLAKACICSIIDYLWELEKFYANDSEVTSHTTRAQGCRVPIAAFMSQHVSSTKCVAPSF